MIQRRPLYFFLFVITVVLSSLLISTTSAFAATGSITLCTVIADGNGCIVTGAAQSGSALKVSWFSPANLNPAILADPSYNLLTPASGIPPSTTFTTPLTLNTKLVGFPNGPGVGGNNARCITFSSLPINHTGVVGYDPNGGTDGPYDFGNYFYKQETITGGTWNSPKYNDGWDSDPSFGSMYTYDNTYFDGNFSNDPPPTGGSVNRSAEGIMTLFWMYNYSNGVSGLARPNRTLVVFNQYGGSIVPGSCVPTSTPTPTPTKTPTPTPTKTGTPTPTKTGTPTPTNTGTPTPTTCTPSAVINLNPSTTNASAGQTILFTAQPVSPIISCGNTIRVDFSSSDTTLATMSPTSDSTSPYTSTATVTSNTAASGVATITAKIYIGGVLISSDTAQLTVTAAAVPSCSFTLSPPSISIASGSTQPFTVSSPVVTNGTIDRVDFSIDNPLAASISPLSKSSASYTTTATGITPGSTATITAKMYVGGDITPTCSSTASISINALAAWWQVKNGDAVTNGSILSSIPSSCSSSATCDPHFITSGGAFTFPGVAFGETGVNPGNGSVSSSGWNATSGYDGKPYSYSYFDTKATCGTVYPLGNSSVTLANLISNPATNGYFWNKYTASPVTIASDLLVDNRKIILFVDNDLTIKGNISVNRGTGLFMVFVSGNIIVDPSVTTLSGVYFTNKEFRTGTAGLGLDQPLSITGSVAAFQQIVLQRNLTDNSGTPAELFEFAPDFLLQFPSCLGEQNVEWRELAP